MKKLAVIYALVAIISCSKKQEKELANLPVVVSYSVQLESGQRYAEQDEGAVCYLFRGVNIDKNSFTVNLDGSIRLDNGRTIQPNEKAVCVAGSVIHFRNLPIGSYNTVVAVSRHYPTKAKAITGKMERRNMTQTIFSFLFE